MEIKIFIESICYVLIILGFFWGGYFLGDGSIQSFFSPQITNETNTDQIPLTFGDEMSDEDIELSKSLVDSLNKVFITRVKSIFFGKNRSEMDLDGELCKEVYGEKGCAGLNLNGDLVLSWKSMGLNRRLLCHELLHDFIFVKTNKATQNIIGYWTYDDPGHKVIDVLAKKEVCYN